MPDARRAKCQNCRRHRDECGELSWRGYCGECGPLLATQAAADLHFHSGPKFEKWRERVAASVGAVLPERLDATHE